MDKKAFTKSCLATALLSLLDERDYNEISIQDIVVKAGFSRMAYYRNFKNTDEILQYLLDSYSQTFAIKTHLDFAELGAEKFFTLIFEYLGKEEIRHVFDVFYKRNLMIFLYREFLSFFSPKDSDEKRIYDHRFVAGGVFGVYLRWIKNGYKETPEQLTAIVMRFMPEEMKTKRED